MNLEAIGAITEAAGSVGVITSLIYVYMSFLYHTEIVRVAVS